MSQAAYQRYYAELGVDEVLADAPIDRYAEAAANKKTAATPVPAQTPTYEAANYTTSPGMREATPAMPAPVMRPAPVAPADPNSFIQQAVKAAEACTTLDELRAAVLAFDGCSLKKTATHTVFADGNPGSDLMLIGEAPGAEEDRQGIPFCGPSGKLLDKMLAAIGYSRESCYITNTLFWRPPGNRKPSSEEVALCQPFVQKHIALFKPKLILMVGGTATSALLNETRGITRLRGTIFSYKNQYIEKDIPALPLYHPSYLLRQPAHKRFAWQDMLKAREILSKSEN